MKFGYELPFVSISNTNSISNSEQASKLQKKNPQFSSLRSWLTRQKDFNLIHRIKRNINRKKANIKCKIYSWTNTRERKKKTVNSQFQWQTTNVAHTRFNTRTRPSNKFYRWIVLVHATSISWIHFICHNSRLSRHDPLIHGVARNEENFSNGSHRQEHIYINILERRVAQQKRIPKAFSIFMLCDYLLSTQANGPTTSLPALKANRL